MEPKTLASLALVLGRPWKDSLTFIPWISCLLTPITRLKNMNKYYTYLTTLDDMIAASYLDPPVFFIYV